MKFVAGFSPKGYFHRTLKTQKMMKGFEAEQRAGEELRRLLSDILWVRDLTVELETGSGSYQADVFAAFMANGLMS